MSEEKDWAATPGAIDAGEATNALDAEGSSPDRVRPSGVGSTHHDFGDYDLGGGRMVSDRYQEPAHLSFFHTPDEQPATTERTFTVVRMWRVEADTVMQALDAVPRDLEPDEIHVSEGAPRDLWAWLRRQDDRG